MEQKIQRLESEIKVLRANKKDGINNDGTNTQFLEYEQALQEKQLEIDQLNSLLTAANERIGGQVNQHSEETKTVTD